MEKAELVIDAKATLGEGPCWDCAKQLLYWVDITEGKVHIYNPHTNHNNYIVVGQKVGCVAPRLYGGLVIAAKGGFYFLDIQTQRLIFISNPEKYLPNNRFNDGKCDACGRFWAGTLSENEDLFSDNTGALYTLNCNLCVCKVLSNIYISNGITWSPDNKIMYYIDSGAYVRTGYNEVWAFDYDILSGTIRNKRVVVKRKSSGEAVFDGMTSDEKGMIWVAQFGGYNVTRFNPYTGETIDTIDVPTAKVTSCIFGGQNLDELYITTAREGLDQKTLEKEPQAGGVFRAKTNVRGRICYPFVDCLWINPYL